MVYNRSYIYIIGHTHNNVCIGKPCKLAEQYGGKHGICPTSEFPVKTLLVAHVMTELQINSSSTITVIQSWILNPTDLDGTFSSTKYINDKVWSPNLKHSMCKHHKGIPIMSLEWVIGVFCYEKGSFFSFISI